MMTHVCVCHACTCGVPNVMKNVRRIENEMDSHRRHLRAFKGLGLKTVNLRSACALKRLSLRA